MFADKEKSSFFDLAETSNFELVERFENAEISPENFTKAQVVQLLKRIFYEENVQLRNKMVQIADISMLSLREKNGNKPVLYHIGHVTYYSRLCSEFRDVFHFDKFGGKTLY